MPWAHALAGSWGTVIGDCPERDSILSRLSHSIAESTASNYGRYFTRFVEFCEGEPDAPSPLPATTATVIRWVEKALSPTVAEQSLQPYLSAINKVHKDVGHEEPAMGYVTRNCYILTRG